MSLVQKMYLALLYVMYDYPKYPGGEVRIREPFKKRRFWFCATRIIRVASSMKSKAWRSSWRRICEGFAPWMPTINVQSS
jgi:hypothetical protein